MESLMNTSVTKLFYPTKMDKAKLERLLLPSVMFPPLLSVTLSPLLPVQLLPLLPVSLKTPIMLKKRERVLTEK